MPGPMVAPLPGPPPEEADRTKRALPAAAFLANLAYPFLAIEVMAEKQASMAMAAAMRSPSASSRELARPWKAEKPAMAILS